MADSRRLFLEDAQDPALENIKFVSTALMIPSVSENKIPLFLSTSVVSGRDTRPQLCPLSLTFSDALRYQGSKTSSREGEIFPTSSYIATFSLLLHCLQWLRKHNQMRKAILKAVLPKRGTPKPPTSPNPPAPWRFHSPPQTVAPRLHPFRFSKIGNHY